MTRTSHINAISPEALATCGAPDLAYVKPVVWEGSSLYALFAADGTRIAVVASRGAAFAVAIQNDLDPVSAALGACAAERSARQS